MTAPAGRPSEAALPAEASGAAVLRHALARGVAALQADRAAALAGDAEAVPLGGWWGGRAPNETHADRD